METGNAGHRHLVIRRIGGQQEAEWYRHPHRIRALERCSRMQVIAEPDLLLDSLARELDRASRYGRELTLVVLVEGAELEPLAAQYCRASDLKGAIGDDLAVALLEADRHVGARYLRRLRSQLGVDFAAGCAHYPSDADTAEELWSRASASARS